MLLSDYSCSESRSLIEHGNECFTHCVNISNALEVAQTKDNSCFPVTIGRRPITDVQPAQRLDGLRDTTNIAFSTPKSNQVRVHIYRIMCRLWHAFILQGSINFSLSTISSTRNTSDFGTNCSRSNMLAAHQNIPIKRINVPEIGIATEVMLNCTFILFNCTFILHMDSDLHFAILALPWSCPSAILWWIRGLCYSEHARWWYNLYPTQRNFNPLRQGRRLAIPGQR